MSLNMMMLITANECRIAKERDCGTALKTSSRKKKDCGSIRDGKHVATAQRMPNGKKTIGAKMSYFSNRMS